ncbi:chorismate-binding protein [Actinotalea sp.]|uniref:chorismate-binding protein n=1 Tax=Actinotalea sp. TaxID=1872145 RepID=UPI0035656A7E
MTGPEVADDERRTPRRARAGRATFPGVRASGVVDHVDLDAGGQWTPDGGFWAVVVDFEGRLRAWRFAAVDRREPDEEASRPGEWVGPEPWSWRSSLDREAYLGAVESVRAAVREGEVYQANICRVLEAPLPAAAGGPDPWALTAVLHRGNPAPYSATLHVPPVDGDAGCERDEGVWIVSASPELFLEVRDGTVMSGPIKGTAPSSAGLGAKDEAENIMITDLVRNDLQRVCLPGTVEVVDLLAHEEHPGLVHLVTRVRGRLREARPIWESLREATFPPASVSGAPKAAALDIIRSLEPVDRGPYCGAIGWWDADSGEAVLAVGIRTFWWTSEVGGTLRFGTGAGITWGSNAAQEWQETELKAARLVALASGGMRRGASAPPVRGEQDGQPDEGEGSR